MYTSTRRAAAQLRRLADLFDAADELPVTGNVFLGAPYSTDEAERVAAVDAIAAVLGLQAEPSKVAGSWSHQAVVDRDGLHVDVSTHIKPPPRRCACGAVCAHDAAVTA